MSRGILVLAGVFCVAAILSALVTIRSGPGDVVSATHTAFASFDVALKMFRLDTGSYPTTEQGLKVLLDRTGVSGWKGPYIAPKRKLVDSWGTPFRYVGVSNGFAIRSAGADIHFDTGDDLVMEEASNHTSEGIRRPADGSPKPSM